MITNNIVLWTHPRCCGTAFELMMEARGDFQCEVNLFDPIYYFTDKGGNDLPEHGAEQATSVRQIYHGLIERSQQKPIFLRNAAYTVARHLADIDWQQMQHTFFIRDPHYALSSHRKYVADITVDEAGYVGQLALFNHLKNHCGITPVVIDAHELLSNPEKMVALWCQKMGIDYLPHAMQWQPGYRERWSMWRRWKEQAANSSGFIPFKAKPKTEAEGSKDSLFAQSWDCYMTLYEERLRA